MLVISVVLLAAGYDLLPVDFENLPLELNDLPWRPRDLAWRYKTSYTNYYSREGVTGYRVNSYQRSNIDLYYDGDGANVFTKSSLEKIQEIENRLTSASDYTNYCQLNVNLTGCEKPMSILRYFDGTYSSIDPVFNDPTFSNVNGVLYEAYTNNSTRAAFQYFLGKAHEITPTTAYSGITRSVIPIGYPLSGYLNDDEGYEKAIRDFSAENMKPILEDIRKNNGMFDFAYRSELLWVEDVFNQAMKDVLCAVGSICFIFIFILIHTKSLWIAGFAILSIMTSFVTTNLIYRIVLDFRYIGFFHVLTLFIVLGIGADDIFVFYDVWRNTAYEDYPSLAHRLSDAYRKSVFSMLFTSITTAVAFFASTISPLLATRSFGVFSGLVVLVNYLSVIIYFPTVVIVYHTRYEHFRWPCVAFIKRQCGKQCKCCLPSSERESHDDTQVTSLAGDKHHSITNGFHSNGVNHQSLFTPLKENSNIDGFAPRVSVVTEGEVFRTKITIDKSGDTVIESSVPSEFRKPNGYTNEAFDYDHNVIEGIVTYAEKKDDDAGTAKQTERYGIFKKRKKKSLMVRFFREKYFAFVTNKYCRVFILLMVAGVLSFFIYQATKLEPDNQGVSVSVIFTSSVFRNN